MSVYSSASEISQELKKQFNLDTVFVLNTSGEVSEDICEMSQKLSKSLVFTLDGNDLPYNYTIEGNVKMPYPLCSEDYPEHTIQNSRIVRETNGDSFVFKLIRVEKQEIKLTAKAIIETLNPRPVVVKSIISKPKKTKQHPFYHVDSVSVDEMINDQVIEIVDNPNHKSYQVSLEQFQTNIKILINDLERFINSNGTDMPKYVCGSHNKSDERKNRCIYAICKSFHPYYEFPSHLGEKSENVQEALEDMKNMVCQLKRIKLNDEETDFIQHLVNASAIDKYSEYYDDLVELYKIHYDEAICRDYLYKLKWIRSNIKHSNPQVVTILAILARPGLCPASFYSFLMLVIGSQNDTLKKIMTTFCSHRYYGCKNALCIHKHIFIDCDRINCSLTCPFKH